MKIFDEVRDAQEFCFDCLLRDGAKLSNIIEAGRVLDGRYTLRRVARAIILYLRLGYHGYIKVIALPALGPLWPLSIDRQPLLAPILTNPSPAPPRARRSTLPSSDSAALSVG